MTQNGEEMRPAQKGVKVNNRTQSLTLSDVWTNLPHSCIGITRLTHSREPLDESTWVFFTIILEGKKQLDACNIHSTHPRLVFVLNHKGTIPAGCLASPQWAGSDTFPTHPTKATFVTRGKKESDGRMKDGDLAVNHWAIFDVNIVRCDLGVSVDLVEEKTASERR
jgi:hypothetical protein